MATVVSCFPTTINNNNRFSILAQHHHYHNYGGASLKDNTGLLGSLHNARIRTRFRAHQSLWSHLGFKSQSAISTPNAVLEAISSEEEFDAAISTAQEQSKPIIIDWMAQWCRKCIYLKPKLEKLASEFNSNVKFYYVDVNAVPMALVKRADVTKMPTIQLWKDGEKRDEVIGGHKAWMVIDEVREMLQRHVR